MRHLGCIVCTHSKFMVPDEAHEPAIYDNLRIFFCHILTVQSGYTQDFVGTQPSLDPLRIVLFSDFSLLGESGSPVG